MPTKVFEELDSSKKENIIRAAMEEFAMYGYENSSTNRIVKECGISKGSLFKYFENKEELYFFLADTVMAEMAGDLSAKANKLPDTLFGRIKAYSEMEISWYIDHPGKGRFIIAIASERGEIYKKINERYGGQGNDIYTSLMDGVDMSGIRCCGQDVSDIVRWVLTGFKNDFLEHTNGDAMSLKEQYTQRLDVYLDILENGMMKESGTDGK